MRHMLDTRTRITHTGTLLTSKYAHTPALHPALRALHASVHKKLQQCSKARSALPSAPCSPGSRNQWLSRDMAALVLVLGDAVQLLTKLARADHVCEPAYNETLFKIIVCNGRKALHLRIA